MRFQKISMALALLFAFHMKADCADLPSSYIARIAALVKSNLMFDLSGVAIENDPVIYKVTLDKNGFFKGAIKVKSSTVPGFDNAVLNAIERSQPFPKDESGNVPSSIVFTNSPIEKSNSLGNDVLGAKN